MTSHTFRYLLPESPVGNTSKPNQDSLVSTVESKRGHKGENTHQDQYETKIRAEIDYRRSEILLNKKTIERLERQVGKTSIEEEAYIECYTQMAELAKGITDCQLHIIKLERQLRLSETPLPPPQALKKKKKVNSLLEAPAIERDQLLMQSDRGARPK